MLYLDDESRSGKEGDVLSRPVNLEESAWFEVEDNGLSRQQKPGFLLLQERSSGKSLVPAGFTPCICVEGDGGSGRVLVGALPLLGPPNLEKSPQDRVHVEMTAVFSSARGLGVFVDSHSPGVVFAADFSLGVGGDSVYCRTVSLMEGLLPEALF